MLPVPRRPMEIDCAGAIGATIARESATAPIPVIALMDDSVRVPNTVEYACWRGLVQRRLQREGVHRRIRIEVHGAPFRGRVADRAHVIGRMHPRELLVGGERRLVAHELRADIRAGDVLFDRAQALRALGMVRAHVVLQAVGVGDKSYRF